MSTPTDPMVPLRGRVLFADDDADARDSLGELLRRLGYQCDCVADAAEARARLAVETYDALLSDIHMPGNSGLELAADVAGSGLPVVLLTGRPSMETAVRSVGLAVAGYLTKPPVPAELVRVLDRAVAAGRNLRLVREGRGRLRDWEAELARLEHVLADPTAAGAAGAPMEDYLRVSLRQVILMLTELERARQALDALPAGRLRQVDYVAALRHTVDVIERTRRNFKSKELADLRRQIEWLLDGGSSPARGTSEGGASD